MEGIVVRPEKTADRKAIEVVHLSAFEGDEEVELIAALRESPGYVPELSLVAEFRQRIVGHVLLTKVWLQGAGDGRQILALAPMAVVPSQSHRGIGSALVEAAIGTARQLGFPAVVETGQREFYQRLGFRPVEEWNLRSNLQVGVQAMTAMELEPGALAREGTVIYPSQFSRVY